MAHKLESDMSDQDSLVEVRNLKKIYNVSRKKKVTALDGVSCQLRPGTCLAIVGESGSGKSTLAKIVMGMEHADGGEVVLSGKKIRPTSSRKELRRRSRVVQMVFQDPDGSLNRSLRVSRTIDEMLQIHRPDLGKSGRRKRLLELFDEVDLSERHAYSNPSSLSGGQKQRVAIARALAAEPEILVLDEAVSALDVSVQAQVLNLLKRARAEHGLSYMFITHDLSVVRDIADDVMVMRKGRVVERGTVDKVLDAPSELYTKILIASAPRPGWVPRRGMRDILEKQEKLSS
jgi:ABC-type glutathione transport system ATPase component